MKLIKSGNNYLTSFSEPRGDGTASDDVVKAWATKQLASIMPLASVLPPGQLSCAMYVIAGALVGNGFEEMADLLVADAEQRCPTYVSQHLEAHLKGFAAKGDAASLVSAWYQLLEHYGARYRDAADILKTWEAPEVEAGDDE